MKVFFTLFFSVVSVYFLVNVPNVSASLRVTRDEKSQESDNVGKVQEQLMSAFDNFKKSVEELTSKINAEDIVHAFHNVTSVLESYAKKTVDQFAATASDASVKVNDEKSN